MLISDLMAMVIFGLLGGGVAFFLVRSQIRGAVFLIILGIILRLIIIAILPDYFVFDDEEGYHQMGVAVRTQMLSGAPLPWEYNPWGNLTGIIYIIFEPTYRVMQLFNMMLGMVSAGLMASVCRLHSSLKILERKVLLLGLFFPPVVVISCLALKEELVTVLLLMCFGRLRGLWRGGAIEWAALASLLYFGRNTWHKIGQHTAL